MRKLYALLAALSLTLSLTGQTARVQVIHNSPSPTVDVYANGALLLDDFVFRTATPFVDLPAGVEIDLAVAPGNSTSVNDAIATFENIVLDETKTYVISAGGIVGDNDYPFTLQVTDAGLEASGNDQVQVNVLHGSPGAPNVDVSVFGGGDLVTNLVYGNYSSYLGVPAGLYLLEIKAAGTPDVVATFTADLSALSGQALTVFASGILGGDPAFGLFAALADGTVVELPLTEFARVQVIHNSPSPDVDVYANGALLLDDFVFRTATPFVDLPAGVEIDLAVAPGNSTSVNDAIATFENIVLDETKTYVISASGIVGDNDYPFTLQVTDAGLEASGSAFVQVNVLHGSPGAPNVDVSVRGGGDLVTDLAYGSYSGYLGVPAGVYDLDIKAAGSSTVVATFTADLSALSGQALTVFASGILGGDPAFGLFAALADGTVVELPQAFFARAQIVHNSPSPTVDIYANGELFINDFEFRTATPFVDLPAGVEIDIAVALGNSTSVDDALFNFDNLVFEADKNYVIFANGIAGDPDFPFTLAVTDAGREEGIDPDAFDVSVFHGSPGAPPVDVFDFPEFQLVDSLAYGNFTPYASLPVNQYILDVRPEGTATTVGYFLADVTDLGGSAGVIFASGQLGGDPGFDLLVVFPDGTVGTLLPLAPVQIIHNSPSPIASTVDIWVNNAVKIVEDLSFRNAEPFTFYPARFPLTFGVAAANSQTPADILINAGTLTLEDGKTYTVIANGIPGDATYPFELAVNSSARIFSESDDQVDVAAFHGSPGAPNVDVDVRGIGNVIDNLAYGDYSGYLNIDPDQYFLEIRANGSPDLVGTFVADLSPLAGLSTVVFASGQLGQDPAFGLFAALPNGTVVELTPVSRVQIIHNSPEPTVDLYIDGELAVDDLAFREATPFLDAETRIPYEIAVAPANSQSVADAIATFSGVTFEDGKSYVVFATGVVGDPETPFDLRIFDAARERSENPDNVDILLYHGAPDAPEVDVVAAGVGVIFDNIAYGEFSADYLSVPAATYTLNVTPATDNTVIVKSYTAPLEGFAGGAGVAFATGFLADEPAFGVWVALPDGTTFPLSEIVASEEVKALLPGFRIMPNPVTDLAQIELTFADAADNVSLIISDATGKTLQTRTLGNQFAGTQTVALDATNLAQGVHFCTIVTEKGVITKRFVVTR